jgi:hypothetical protein
MKGDPRLVVRSLLLTLLAIPACASRGTMTYEEIVVTGRPQFSEYGDDIPADRHMTLYIKEGSPEANQPILWDNHVLDRRRIDPKRRYQFKLLEGTVIDFRGTKHTDCQVWQAYDHQQLIYDASFCRVHERTMQRESSEEGIDAVDLPRGFDSAKARRFPNTRFDHAACSSPTYSGLDWTCPQCSDAEAKWLEKNSKPNADGR